MEYKPLAVSEAQAQDLVQKKKAELHDLVPAQIRELFIIDHIQEIPGKHHVEQHDAYKKYAEGKQADSRLFYYPWLNKIFRSVGENDFFILKTNRNRDLMTWEEQVKLRKFTVAVLGLSVGSNIAFLLSQAGISNKIFLADPDTLDTTNLNRLLTGVQDLGINKSIIACRKIAEANPYAQPVAMENGINEENLEALLREEMIHCIVEEVDSIPVKISTRKLAIQFNVPVLMITDNGFSIVVHLERYDLGHKQIFEKDMTYWDETLKEELTHQRISQIIIENIFGSIDKIDPKLLASNLRIMKKELVSWPQLGSTAMLGGTVATQLIRKIALDESREPFIKKFISFNF